MVESWPESLKMDSSRAEVCSGDVPCLLGSCVRASFSTCPYLTEISKVEQGHQL